jgi:hypothetical protein
MPILPTSLDPISNCLLIAASHHANFSPLTLDSHQPQPKLKAAAILSDLTSASSPAARLLPFAQIDPSVASHHYSRASSACLVL